MTARRGAHTPRSAAPKEGAAAVCPPTFGALLERLRGGERPATVLFVGEYAFPTHTYDESYFARVIEALHAIEPPLALFSHDAEGDGFDERSLHADLQGAALFGAARAIVVRRAEDLCRFPGRARKSGERTRFETTAARFQRETRDGSILLVELPTRTEKDPLANDLRGEGGIVVVCPRTLERGAEPASGFAVSAAVLEGRARDALRLLASVRRDGLSLGAGEVERDPRALYPILFARLYESARRAARVRILLDSGKSIRDAGDAVGSKAWPGSDLDRAARARPAAGHARLLRRLRALDAAVKSSREPDAFFALERLAAGAAEGTR